MVLTIASLQVVNRSNIAVWIIVNKRYGAVASGFGTQIIEAFINRAF